MKKLQALWTPLALASMVYALYAVFTDAWPMGWINLAQQWVFGAYSWKVSMLVLITGMLLALAFVWSFFDSGPDTAAAAAPLAAAAPERAPASPTRTLWLSGIVILALIWASGLGAAWWYRHQAQAEVQARYQPLLLQADAAAVVKSGEYRAVQGVMLASHAVVHRVGGDGASGRDDHWLVPVVSTAWRPGTAASLVLKVQRLSDLPGHAPGGRSWLLPEPVLVRVGGSVAVPAAHAFGQAGVPLEPGHHQLQWIASRHGVPVPDDADPLLFALWCCSAISVLTLVLLGAAAWGQRRHRLASERRPAARFAAD